MILRGVELVNYRRFKREVIEFPDGLIGIVGENGAGKTTLIEAVAWALFGNQTALVRTEKEAVRGAYAAPSDPCKVALAFSIEGDSYEAIREMRGTNQVVHANLMVNGKQLATGDREVNKKVASVIGMDYGAFSTSVYARQKELNAMSQMRPAERKQLIMRMLRIDAVDDAVAEVRKDIRDCESEIKGIGRVLVRDDGTDVMDEIKGKLKDAESAMAKEIRDAEVLKGNLERAETGFGKLDEKFKSELKKKDDWTRLKGDLKVRQTRLESLTESLERSKKDIDELASREKNLKVLEKGEKDYLDTRKKIDDMEGKRKAHIEWEGAVEKVKSLKERREEVLGKKKELEPRLKELETLTQEREEFLVNQDANLTEIETLKEQQAGHRTLTKETEKRLKEVREHLKTVEKLGPESPCPTCLRPLQEHESVLLEKLQDQEMELELKLEEVKQDLDKVTGELGDCEAKKKALEKRRQYLDDQERKAAGLRARLEESSKDQKRVEKDLANAEKKLASIKDPGFDEKVLKDQGGRLRELEKDHERFLALKRDLERLPKLKEELAAGEKRSAATNGEIKEMERKMAELGFDPDNFKPLSEKFEKGRVELERLKRNVALSAQRKVSAEKELKNAKDRLDDFEKQAGKVRELEERVRTLKILTTVMNDFKQHLISRIQPTISAITSELFHQLTDGRYSTIDIDENYDMLVTDQGETHSLSRFSGGEEDLANLCFRLAISRSLAEQTGGSGPQFVILDEIFGSQDHNRKRNLMATLAQLQNRFRQIFVITHIEDVKDYFTTVIEVTDQGNGTSKITMS